MNGKTKKLLEKSDALDEKIVAVSEKEYSGTKLRYVISLTTLAFVIAGFISMFVILQNITKSTNKAVRQEIPGLQKQIGDRDKTIKDQNSIINQETDAILKLAKQVQDLGGDPGHIEIRPR